VRVAAPRRSPAMPVGYNPTHFFGVAFAFKGGAWSNPRVFLRALALMPLPVALVVLEMQGYLDEHTASWMNGMYWGSTDVSLPFSVLIGLMTSFRLSDAFQKWERAVELLLQLHTYARVIVSGLSSFLPQGNDEAIEKAVRIRRLLVLGCMLIKRHVRGEIKAGVDDEFEHGLITEEERAQLKKVCTVASGAMGDGKKDKYPSKNRPAFAFQQAQMVNHELFAAGHYKMPHAWAKVDDAITHMSDTIERCEHLGTTLLPLPYAQLTRLTTIVFLQLVVPFAVIQDLKWCTIPLCLVSNIVYFLTDECASQMEMPFGQDLNDVDLEKMVRRIDKHTACQLAQFTNAPVENFNLFPEARATDLAGNEKVGKRGSKAVCQNSTASVQWRSASRKIKLSKDMAGLFVAQVAASSAGAAAALGGPSCVSAGELPQPEPRPVAAGAIEPPRDTTLAQSVTAGGQDGSHARAGWPTLDPTDPPPPPPPSPPPTDSPLRLRPRPPPVPPPSTSTPSLHAIASLADDMPDAHGSQASPGSASSFGM